MPHRPGREVSRDDMAELLDLWQAARVGVWVDGGWAVDALLGEQSRRHRDVDIVVERRDVGRLRRLMAERGFGDRPRGDTTTWNFVLGDARGRDVDVHVITLEPDGTGRYSPDENFPAGSLDGTGTIAGRAVRCVSALWLVRFKTGYAFDDDDVHDVLALCSRFGIAVPEAYQPAAERRRQSDPGAT